MECTLLEAHYAANVSWRLVRHRPGRRRPLAHDEKRDLRPLRMLLGLRVEDFNERIGCATDQRELTLEACTELVMIEKQASMLPIRLLLKEDTLRRIEIRTRDSNALHWRADSC